MSKWGHAIRAAGFAVAAYACAGVTNGFAADMPLFGGDPAPQTKVEFGTGWYIRGDAGWAFDQVPVIGPNLLSETTKPKNNFAVDLGSGYKFNNWIRGDLTLGLFGVESVLVNGNAATPTVVTGQYGTLEKYLLLLNTYIDLGTWYGITPFVGAGVGGDMLRQAALTDSARKYNFAWALMAGAAYNLTDNAAIEVGYRYVRFGDFIGVDSLNGAIFNKNLSAQEIRLGVRYLID
jgi:opacity protein-like surface antigen